MYTQVVGRPRELRPRHSVENQWDLLDVLQIPRPTREADPAVMVTRGDMADEVATRLAMSGMRKGDQLIVMHVSAGNAFRRWPLESFGGVAASLVSRDRTRRVIVTSGPSEAEAAARVVALAQEALPPEARTRVVAWSDNFPLEQLRAVMESAALYIGGDSGPMHIAATSRVPMVSLYGPTLPARSAPWRADTRLAIAVEVPGLDCRPCDQRVCAPGDFRCLTRITPDQVVEAADTLLARHATGPSR